MYCPKCKSEFREGFTTCSDCGAALVDSLQDHAEEKGPGAKFEYTDYVLVLSTFRFSDVALIKSVFDGEGIIYFIQGEDLGVAPGGLPARVLVKKEQAEEAKQLLKDFNLI